MISTAKKKLQLAVIVIFLTALGVSFTLLAQAQNPASKASPVTDWRPNRAAQGWRFVGSKACAECHAAKFKTQTATHMGRALFVTEKADVLRANPKLAYRNGQYNYQLTRDGNRTTYAVNDGVNTLSLPIFYVFGDADMGQTYVLQYKDKFYEGRVSYYPDIKGLDLTMGHAPKPPATLVEAMGREMQMDETRACFGCHSTNALNGGNLQFDQMLEGVTCEACHGPGEKHVAAMQAGELDQKQIFNPKKLSTDDLSNFCGTCHRTWEQVAVLGIRGPLNVRFQPYRLTNSKCYDSEDPRISCLACHDPHEPRKRDAAFFDSKCAACHSTATKITPAAFKETGKHEARSCPVGKANCVSCHMPKVEIPGSHFHFSDHHIRIVRPGDPYPN
jgi:Cytochrome c554 and c-prime/Cytochrome c3